MSKSKAVHNEALCDLLIKDGNYNDWVITTAFYSAMHYVRHQIFPFTHPNRTYQNFDTYYSFEIQSKKPRKSKHRALIDLVQSNLSACYPSYKWLHDACFKSRYNNYNVTPLLVIKAKQELDKIKACCTKP